MSKQMRDNLVIDDEGKLVRRFSISLKDRTDEQIDADLAEMFRRIKEESDG